MTDKTVQENFTDKDQSTSTDNASAASLGLSELGLGMAAMNRSKIIWDPTSSTDWDKEKPDNFCILRIQKDISNIYSEPPPFICIAPCEEDLTKIEALIFGPGDTPYEGGFFTFFIRCSPNYPITPPRVRFMTTGGGNVRFNPNFYPNGKVCLSILGTWPGPPWQASQSISSLLLSIQSLMNENPYHNEPGYEGKEKCIGDSQRYNNIIHHETLRVAVCEVMEMKSQYGTCPKQLRHVVETSFIGYYDYYVSSATERLHCDGMKFVDPFHTNKGTFCYKDIIKRLHRIKSKLDGK